ncbi:hypothetical protein ANANG_G00074650 [Anguilla anguilla]|uniref:Uncharacterized protein n=1 Tax=Anguilla anguilla TaxID=7936 RepID=A0A9D3MNS5_ANGAN|nr:hypothetical protein ANANG_G00074650 [Anguilla anguilla]
MDFLKSLLPVAVLGEEVLETGEALRDVAPRRLRVRRLARLSRGLAIDEGPQGPATAPTLPPCKQTHLKEAGDSAAFVDQLLVT